MANIPNIRKLLETMHTVAPFLNDEEVSDIGKVLLKVIARLEEENECKSI